MDQIARYAVYYAPPEGPFAFRANEWLGRDPANGNNLPQPVLAGIGDPHTITAEPRRYGFHGLNYEHVVDALPRISGKPLPRRILAATAARPVEHRRRLIGRHRQAGNRITQGRDPPVGIEGAERFQCPPRRCDRGFGRRIKPRQRLRVGRPPLRQP